MANYRAVLRHNHPDIDFRFRTPKFDDYNDIEFLNGSISKEQLDSEWEDYMYEARLDEWKTSRKAIFENETFNMFRLLYLDQKNGTTQFSDYVDNILNNLPPRPTR